MSSAPGAGARPGHGAGARQGGGKAWCPRGFPGSIVHVKAAEGTLQRASSVSVIGGARGGRRTSQEKDGVSAERERDFATRVAAASTDVGGSRDEGLRKLAWGGIPNKHRPAVWRLLVHYMPVESDRRARELSRKRREYQDYVSRYYETVGMILNDGSHHLPDGASAPPEQELRMRHQIHIDVPRTLREYGAFRSQFVQQSMERLLYIWAIRHPASGYVQGINDLTTPFFIVFLSEFLDVETLLSAPESECDKILNDSLDADARLAVEADTYWCLTNLLRYIQDNYTFAQPGVQRMVARLEEILTRYEPALVQHFEDVDFRFMTFAVRWMNCLLTRELPLNLTVRLWDTYLAEADGFPSLHVYVCCALLIHWKDTLMGMSEMADMMLFIQSLNKRHVFLKDLEKWISLAYVMQHQDRLRGTADD